MELVQRFRLWYYTQPPALRAILTINVVLYVLWQFVFRHVDITAEFVNSFLSLRPALPGIVFHPWQLLTEPSTRDAGWIRQAQTLGHFFWRQHPAPHLLSHLPILNRHCILGRTREPIEGCNR